MNIKTEAQLKIKIDEFVASLEGRYRKHVSDEFLSALLLMRVICAPKDLYGAACPVFEYILEGHCKVIGNGHHVAQKFATAISEGQES